MKEKAHLILSLCTKHIRFHGLI